ncbi:hypothetical protein ACKKBF_B11900 [Auxenochlorella protothecoides x Auxenochlorella symbiontica]
MSVLAACRGVRLLPGGLRQISTATRRGTAAPEPVPAASPSLDDTASFRAADIRYELSAPNAKLNLADLKFGAVFTDHMFLTEHVAGRGWSTPTIGPFQTIAVHPAAPVLHYGLCCFEGMKAYAGADGRARLFRPDMNMRRLARSAARLQLAPFDTQELLECLKELVRTDSAWLPTQDGYSMYIRPYAFSTSHTLGVSRSTRTTLGIIMSPVGPYFPSGLTPIPIFVDEVHRRAWPGGVGDSKVGGNYAPTILPQVEAAERHGTPQVVYTFAQPGQAPEEAVFEECGSMNVMFLLDKGSGHRELVTPPLHGTILPGVTRDSILALARAMPGVEVSERTISIGEVERAAAAGRLLEAFGCGTACIVQPISSFVRAGGQLMRAAGDGAFVARMHAALCDIQYGRVSHPWSIPI